MIPDYPNLVGVPGHVVKNDFKNGVSHVLSGNGVLGLKVVQWGGETEGFPPGKRWKSVQLILGLSNGYIANLLCNKK